MKNPGGARRLAPSEATAEAMERIAPRRQLGLEKGDVVITRERVPRVNPKSAVKEPQWRYRVARHPDPHDAHVFNSFAHAASYAEQWAGDRRLRIIYVDDGMPSLIADYRR